MYTATGHPTFAPPGPAGSPSEDLGLGSTESPAVADTAFVDVPEPLREALVRRGFTRLTSVQSAILAADDGSRDLQISSQTGSGKTVALGFVLAPRLIASPATRQGPTTLIITPTRELAMQVKDELSWLLADLRSVTLDCVTGGTVVRQEQQRLSRPPTILVGTPGRLLDHIRTGALACSGVTQLVLDEADQMLDLGFRDDLEAILATMPAERRTHLISATFPAAVRALTLEYQRDALHVEGTALGTAHEDIEHTVHPLDHHDRYAALVNLLLLAGGERTLVFVRTRIETTELADQLTTHGFAAQPISGELTQTIRTRTLEAFRRGTITTLIATDVAARGLDIPLVTTVVHFDPPTDGAIYTHRSGRTGRAGQKGRSVLLAPKGAKRRVQRILGEAKVVANWIPAPDAATVRARQALRAEQRLRQALTEPVPTGEHHELATKLLLEFAPTDLVAGLLRTLAAHDPQAPLEVATVPARAGRDGGGAEADRMAPRPGRPRSERDVERVRFRINWGIAQGAIPKRILAHVCRRGEIRGADVGAIAMQAHTSSFDISAEVADAFALRVRARDPRDPNLVIERDAGGGQHSDRPRGGERSWAPSTRPAPRPWSKRARAAYGAG